MINIGIIGYGYWGPNLVRNFAETAGATVAAVADLDTAKLELVRRRFPAVKTTTNFQDLLADSSIDAIAVATPDHWHALMTVMGCQAGKDVYVEKPASHNLVEGRRMVEAARKYNRIVQIGTQRRSAPHVRDAIEHVHSGAIGKVGLARAWIHQKRSIDVSGEPQPVPSGIDYGLWQGPAPDRPFIPNRFHYNWHWFWNWGTGELGNNGIHGLDVARWGLGEDAPVRVGSGGGIYLFQGIEVPDTQIVTWEFPETSLVWEHRMWSQHGLEGSGFGIAFYGDQGTVIVDGKGWRVEDGKAAGGNATGDQALHIANFLDCIKSRNKPNADIEIGHLSTRLCHLGNIAHRVGRKLTFDAQTETFPNDSEANALLMREYSSRFEMPSQV